VYLGIDDTDSREGMCTTYVGLVSILNLIEDGYYIIGYPRLVRLNPNIPWKTRGNGAVAIRFGRGAGERIKIGTYKGEDIYAYSREKKGSPRFRLEEFADHISGLFVVEDENTNPGIVFSEKKLREFLYWRAVRSVVELEEVETLLINSKAEYLKFKLGRGIIGAAASIAWRARRKTYEVLTYSRESDRYVSHESAIALDTLFPTTFDNYDYQNEYLAIKPNSHTPVLFGIRGTVPDDLLKAVETVESSPYEAFLIYETNQASDDHLVRKKIRDVRPYESVILRGRVLSKPRRIPGGHVIFKIGDSTGSIECAAYEPTKQFRNVVNSLVPGDTVEVYGGVRGDPLTVNLEKIFIEHAPPYRLKIANPRCPVCGRRMESIGRNRGYRCRRCGTRAGESEAEYAVVVRNIEGFHEVPVIARRHLSRPLKLMELRKQ